MYQYKVVQIPATIPVSRGQSGQAGAYVEQVINGEAQQGWEFYRIDTISTVENPGCLGALLGGKQSYANHCVISFRRVMG
jgi:hypothetical protein